MTDTAPGDRTPLTSRDRLRRLGIALVVAVCLGGLALGAAATREVDANGDVITEENDPNAVTISGDDDLVAQQPPNAVAAGPSEAEIVEQTIPAEGAEILQQQQIGIDLGNAYKVNRLLVDRTPIDESHLTRRDELNQVFFQPAEGYEFESFPAGRVCAQAEVVDAITNEPVRTVEWCFEVT